MMTDCVTIHLIFTIGIYIRTHADLFFLLSALHCIYKKFVDSFSFTVPIVCHRLIDLKY